MRYHPVTSEIIEELKSIVGEENVVLDPEKLETYGMDEVSEAEWQHAPEVVVKPENAEQISRILKLANRELIPVTPRGQVQGYLLEPFLCLVYFGFPRKNE